MFRQSVKRYQRAKGLKVKHVLQIAIVTIVLTWVAYELNQSRKPANSQEQDRSAFHDTVQDPSLDRRALKPEGELGNYHLETKRQTPTDPEDTTTKSSLEENVDGSRAKEDADDQRDRDISDLDMERASDQGSYFEELKNEQERAEQEEVEENDKDGETEEDGDSQSLKSELTTSSTEGRIDGDNHLDSVVDGDTKAGQTTDVTFMDVFNDHSVLKHKLDKLDEGQVEDTSRAHIDEKLDSAIEALKEATEDSRQEEAFEVSKVSTGLDTAEDNVDSQSEVEDTQVNLVTQSNEQSDVNKEKLSVESFEEGKVEKFETQEQKQAPVQKQVGEEEKPEEKHDILPHVQEEQEQEEKKREKELVEKKAEVKGTESDIQPELKSEGAEVDISEKNENQHGNKESLENVAGEFDSSTQGSEGENKSLAQSEETDDNQRRSATEKSIHDFLGTSAEDKKEEAQQYHGGVETQNGSESHQGNTEQKKDESGETNQVETDSKGISDLSDDSNSKVEKHSHDNHSAETVNTDASKLEDSKQEDEAPKDEVLKQVTDSNAVGSGESETKVEDQFVEKSNKPDREVTGT